MTKQDYDRSCRDTFGSKSIWDGSTNTEGLGYCTCAKKYKWNSDQTSCIKQ